MNRDRYLPYVIEIYYIIYEMYMNLLHECF